MIFDLTTYRHVVVISCKNAVIGNPLTWFITKQATSSSSYIASFEILCTYNSDNIITA